MRALVAIAIVSLAACSGAPLAIESDAAIADASIDLPPAAADLADQQCGVVQFCVPFLDPKGASFSECVLPPPPGGVGPAFMPYYECVLAAGTTGACESACAHPDLGYAPGCLACLDGTCANGVCSGGACSSEATACGLTQ